MIFAKVFALNGKTELEVWSDSEAEIYILRQILLPLRATEFERGFCHYFNLPAGGTESSENLPATTQATKDQST